MFRQKYPNDFAKRWIFVFKKWIFSSIWRRIMSKKGVFLFINIDLTLHKYTANNNPEQNILCIPLDFFQNTF